MKKKNYLVPQVKEVSVKLEQHVLAGSGGIKNMDVSANVIGDEDDDWTN